MKMIENPLRHVGLSSWDALAVGEISTDHQKVLSLLRHCPSYEISPLVVASKLAANLGVSKLFFKDERLRMGLGSFKALGAAYAIAKAAYAKSPEEACELRSTSTVLKDEVFVCASAGNHGLSVAAGARIFGARAIIYLSKTVPESFAAKLETFGAQVIIEGENYEESMEAAKIAADANHWTLLSDSTWENYNQGRDVMEGYLALVQEIMVSLGDNVPSHVFLQAGVGGLAGAATAMIRKHWGDDPIIFVVEPMCATALMDSVIADGPVIANGPVSTMGRLDCKEPSHLALKCLAKEADYFIALDDEEVEASIRLLEPYNLTTSPSGGAGFAGLRAVLDNADHEYSASMPSKHSRVLIILSEGQQEAE